MPDHLPMPDVKALAFDVFGTVVDWRGSIMREGEKFGAAHGVRLDWSRFADAWRTGYQPAMQRVRSGELPWMKSMPCTDSSSTICCANSMSLA